MKASSKKVLSALLALVMVVSMLSMSALAIDNPLVTTDVVDGLSISVDYDTELVYLQKVSSTEYNVLCDSTNGYYPFSFSMIMNARSNVNGRPAVSNDGSFAWAYDETTGEESSTTPYGLVTLPVGSASTVTVTTANNQTITFNCSAPNGGTSAAGSSIYAFLPAPGQFTNESVTSGGWGDAYDSNGTLKNNIATGMSLGFFGGYVVYKFDNPVANDPSHPYGADFIVYGNAFWNNSEPGCIQVSQDGSTWYDIAGSRYYNSDTVKNFSLTYQNPNVSEDADITAAGSNLGILAAVSYTGSASGTITTNNFHKHSWFPLNANYFSGRYGNTALDKVSALSFASRTIASGVTDTLTLSGVKLSNVSTNDTAGYGFGYCDVHPNNDLGGTVAYNPYQSFTSSSDYSTKTEGTSGGDPIDISWAVDGNGNPVKLSSIQYVRVYTGAAQMNGIFGEVSTEACGIAACTGTGTGTAVAPTITIDDMTLSDLEESDVDVTPISVSGTQQIIEITGLSNACDENVTLAVSGGTYIYINGVATSTSTISVASETLVQIINQSGTAEPFVTLLKLSA